MTMFKNLVQSLFNKNYEAIWKQFAIEKNGKYLEGHYGEQDAVEIKYKNHIIKFDSYIYRGSHGHNDQKTEFTRIRLEFKSADNFKFRIMNQGIIDTIGKIFGLQDIQIGDKLFDRKFMIKGNDELKVQQLLSSAKIKEQMMNHKDLQLQVLDKEGIFYEKIQENHVMLYYISEEIITTVEQLNTLLQLYRDVFDQLINMCSVEK